MTRNHSDLHGFGQIGDRLEAPATGRNRAHILKVLKTILPVDGTVLEIASGSGEHAVFFAPEFDTLTWQPSDPEPRMIRSITAWRTTVPSANINAPLKIDVLRPGWAKDVSTEISGLSTIVCINMIHVAPMDAARGLLAGAGQLLPPGGPLLLYGPFRINGRHTAPSNEAFDQRLRAENPAWGVRDLGEITEIADQNGLQLEAKIEMPANNFSIIFRRGGS